MSVIQDYLDVLSKTDKIALATSVDNVPNVRVVNFCYRAEQPNLLYFASDRQNQKVAEFGKNNKIAFTSIPNDSVPHVRSRNAIVQKSRYSLDEIKDLFIANIPGYDEAIKAIGETLDVFEIHIKEATVVAGFGPPEAISF